MGPTPASSMHTRENKLTNKCFIKKFLIRQLRVSSFTILSYHHSSAVKANHLHGLFAKYGCKYKNYFIKKQKQKISPAIYFRNK